MFFWVPKTNRDGASFAMFGVGPARVQKRGRIIKTFSNSRQGLRRPAVDPKSLGRGHRFTHKSKEPFEVGSPNFFYRQAVGAKHEQPLCQIVGNRKQVPVVQETDA